MTLDAKLSCFLNLKMLGKTDNMSSRAGYQPFTILSLQPNNSNGKQ